MELKEFFKTHNTVAIAFSGGVDSAYLLCEAVKYCEKVCAYYVKSDFQPEFEFNDAKRLISELGAEWKVLELDVLSDENITKNPENRCYYCKKKIISKIKEQALKDGFNILLDGTNASDDLSDRPGSKAIKELSVLSPLRECGLTKEEIRNLSEKENLFTWDKPSYACLATRIPTGEVITKDKLTATEKAEDFLFSLGFKDFRVRMFRSCARLQVKENQVSLLMEKREEILTELKKYYSGVLFDLEVR